MKYMESVCIIVIRFGPTTNPLGRYYVFDSRERIIRSESFNKPAELFSNLKNLINIYHADSVLVEEPSSLIKVRKMLLGRRYLNKVKWKKKYKCILDIRNTIVNVVAPVKVDFFDAKCEDYDNSNIKFSYGKFIKLTDEGEAIFAHKKIEFSIEELLYAANIYGVAITDKRIIFGKPNDKNVFIKNNVNSSILVLFDKKINKTIEIPFDEKLSDDKVEAFNKNYKLMIFNPAGDKFLIQYYFGSKDSVDQALMEYLIKDMINWINETKNIDFLLGVIRRDPLKALRFAEKFRKNRIV